MPSLEGPKVKLARAHEHLCTLGRELVTFMESSPYRSVREFDADSGEHVWRLEIERPAPVRLGVLAGDVAHNLSSSLDHLAWQLALLTTDSPRKRTGFPIYKDAGPGERCFDPEGLSKMRSIPKAAQQVIEPLQPYHRPKPMLDDLWLLREINTMDKHRIILKPVPAPIGWNLPSPHGALTLIYDPSGDDGCELLRLGLLPPDYFDGKDEVNVHFDVVIDTPEVHVGRRSGVCNLLYRIHQTIRDDVVPRFETFFTNSSP